MSINIFQRRRNALINASGLPDFSGYDITRMYAPFKSSLATSDNFATLKRPSSAANPTISFDNGEPDFSGLSANNWFYDDILCQITGHSVVAYNVGAPDANQFCKAYDSTTGTITKNGLPSYNFLGSTGGEGTAISELDTGNDFTITVIASHDTSGGAGAVLNSTDSAGDRLTVFCSRDTNKNTGLIRDTTTYICTLDAQQNSSDLRIINFLVNGTTGLMEVCYNDVLQADTETYTGTYTNDMLRFGAQLNGATGLLGHLSTVIISDSLLDSTARSGLNAKLNAIFSIY